MLQCGEISYWQTLMCFTVKKRDASPVPGIIVRCQQEGTEGKSSNPSCLRFFCYSFPLLSGREWIKYSCCFPIAWGLRQPSCWAIHMELKDDLFVICFDDTPMELRLAGGGLLNGIASRQAREKAKSCNWWEGCSAAKICLPPLTLDGPDASWGRRGRGIHFRAEINLLLQNNLCEHWFWIFWIFLACSGWCWRQCRTSLPIVT